MDPKVKPYKLISILNYKDNHWVIIPDHLSVKKMIYEISQTRRIDSTFGLFEDIYDSLVLKNVENTRILVNKISMRFCKYRIKIKRYKLIRKMENNDNFQKNGNFCSKIGEKCANDTSFDSCSPKDTKYIH